MSTWQTRRQYLTRTAILATIVASLVVAVPQDAGASRASEAGSKGDTFAAMCRAAGGTPTWTTSIDSIGTVTYIVECDGGYLDGLNCFFDEEFTDCTMTRFGGGWLSPTIDLVEIAPFDEPTTTPQIDAVEDTTVIAPIELDAPDTPTPEPGVYELFEPVVSDGDAAPEPTATPGDGVDVEPVVDDGVIIDEVMEPDLAEEPIVIEPHVDVEDIAPIEAIILT